MHANYWSVPPEWTNETCFIIAGGPSLVSGIPAKRLLTTGRVLVINVSYQLVPSADCLYFCDQKWWQSFGSHVRAFFGGRYLVTLDNQIEGVKRLKSTGPQGLESDPCGLRTGSNSGFQAINLAYHFGARRIVLLGYDMHVTSGRTHWHQGYPTQQPHDFARILAQQMLPKFMTLVEPLRTAGVEVINATPGSALTCWPYVPLDSLI